MKNFHLVPVLVFATISSTIVCENCDQLGVLVYEDMSCKPFYGKGNSCPSRYDCKGLQKSNNTCYFKGKQYKVDEQVNSELTAPSCDLGCFCEKNQNNMKFFCAALDCPEWLGPPKPGCYRKYSLEACCSVREICPPFDNTTQCIYDGKQYKEGENFLPKDSCWRCACQEGFQGKIKPPFCRRRACGVQVKYQAEIQKKCAPVYYKRAYRKEQILCCPNFFICPDGNEKITGKSSGGASCRFGNRSVRFGEGFVKNITEAAKTRLVNCQCKVPPLLTCLTEIF